METKICNKCKIEKSTTDFYKKNKIYIASICKSCRIEKTMKWIKNNPNKYKELVKRFKTSEKGILQKKRDNKKSRQTLSKDYIKQTLISILKIKYVEIPEKLIEFQRAKLTLYRTIKPLK